MAAAKFDHFWDPTNLTTVIIEPGATEITSFLFMGYKKLKSVTIPGTVAEIQAYAFAGCTSLENIVIPEGVKTISGYAFEGCTSLTSVTLPESLREIGDGALPNNPDMPEVRYGGSRKSWDTIKIDTFNGKIIERIILTCEKGGGTFIPGLEVRYLMADAYGMGKVKLCWALLSGAYPDGYLILRNGKQIGYTANTVYMDAEANPDDFNYYWVIPYIRKDGKTIIGDLSDYTWALGRYMDSVTGLKTRSGAGQVTLSWDAEPGANAYVILSRTGSPKAAFNPRVTVTGTSYTDSGKSGVIYYWVLPIYNNASGQTIAAGTLSDYAWGVAK